MTIKYDSVGYLQEYPDGTSAGSVNISQCDDESGPPRLCIDATTFWRIHMLASTHHMSPSKYVHTIISDLHKILCDRITDLHGVKKDE